MRKKARFTKLRARRSPLLSRPGTINAFFSRRSWMRKTIFLPRTLFSLGVQTNIVSPRILPVLRYKTLGLHFVSRKLQNQRLGSSKQTKRMARHSNFNDSSKFSNSSINRARHSRRAFIPSLEGLKRQRRKQVSFA